MRYDRASIDISTSRLTALGQALIRYDLRADPWPGSSRVVGDVRAGRSLLHRSENGDSQNRRRSCTGSPWRRGGDQRRLGADTRSALTRNPGHKRREPGSGDDCVASVVRRSESCSGDPPWADGAASPGAAGSAPHPAPGCRFTHVASAPSARCSWRRRCRDRGSGRCAR